MTPLARERDRGAASLVEVLVMSALGLILLVAVLGAFRFAQLRGEFTEKRLDAVAGVLVIMERLRADLAQVAVTGSGRELAASGGEVAIHVGGEDAPVRYRHDAEQLALSRNDRRTGLAQVRTFEATCGSPATGEGWLLSVSLAVGDPRSRATTVQATLLAPPLMHRARFPEWVDKASR